jgi:hypothetical protein
MDEVKKHFEEEAAAFDGLIIQRIPYYEQVLDAAGFSEVDVIWKYYNYAVYDGRKQ